MEVANILDIDGTQWELQDLEARNKIANLEQEIQENTEIIQGLNKNVGEGFIAKRNIKNIIMYPFETCFISGYVSGVGPYMAILAANGQNGLIVSDLYGSASNYMNIKVLDNFKFELTLDGPINLFGFVKSAS